MCACLAAHSLAATKSGLIRYAMQRPIAGVLAAGVAVGLAVSAIAQPAARPLERFDIKDGGIPASLTGRAGDPQKGRQVVTDRLLGNCLACHAISAITDQSHQGNVGPSLDGVASRLSEAQLRLRIVDPSRINPNTMMPPFYRVDGLHKVMGKFEGKPILTAEQVEDAVAFLETLR